MRTTVDSHGVSLDSALSELNTTLGILYTDTKTLAAKSTSNISEIITVTYDDIMGPETKSDENSDFGNLLYVIKYNRRVYRFSSIWYTLLYIWMYFAVFGIFSRRECPKNPLKTVHSGGKSKPEHAVKHCISRGQESLTTVMPAPPRSTCSSANETTPGVIFRNLRSPP